MYYNDISDYYEHLRIIGRKPYKIESHTIQSKNIY